MQSESDIDAETVLDTHWEIQVGHSNAVGYCGTRFCGGHCWENSEELETTVVSRVFI